MTQFRSLLFFVALQVWTLGLGTLYLPLLLAPRAAATAAAKVWVRGVFVLLKTLCGLSWQVRGTPPAGAALVASKHQSTLETFAYRLILSDPAVILKKELLRIPIFGWYLGKTGVIAIDRAAGTRALKDMVKGAGEAVAEGRQVLIFPEGHRMDVGEAPDYHSGVAMLYAALGVACVPAALNTGMFWGRGSLAKRPGIATIEFLEPIPPGLDRKAFMAELQRRIEEASARLADEARAG
ncbi:1-acyl-sn-glycerol-3-phosphate acyltransferase [Magnetospirillum sp. UT-4]|uniref:lysophospholipid acyltransferase family protein n=1 Tax=Magnetospirillum sp. UT-4 TaxID=2681467 RepID=UPI001384D19A|nr:lysophospholipid acyltransferase family protein [Magnetospirillum sp. UT-4]CAA7616421.1 putative 1-acylglycerol-3-phosphate O-acyltransferase (PlsC) [Magnetospirillum sp. UT-4]